MLSYRSSAVAAVLPLAVASSASAQFTPETIDRWSFRAAVGPSVLRGDAGDATNLGFTIVVAPELRIGASPLRIGAELSIARHGIDSEAAGEPGETLEGDVSVFGLALTGTYALPAQSTFSPFVRGGIGSYRLDIALEGQSGTEAGDTEDALGFFGGIGVEFNTVRFSPSLEVRYHTVSTSGERTSYIPVLVGVRF